MPTLDRLRERHNEIVKQLTRLQTKRDKAIAALVRADAKLASLIKAVARSAKRLDKARSLAALNAGPVLGDLPDLPRVPVEVFGADAAPDAIPAHVQSVPLAELHKTDHGKANAKSWNAIPAVAKAKRKARRTPDDFKADIAGRKGSATRGRIAE